MGKDPENDPDTGGDDEPGMPFEYPAIGLEEAMRGDDPLSDFTVPESGVSGEADDDTAP